MKKTTHSLLLIFLVSLSSMTGQDVDMPQLKKDYVEVRKNFYVCKYEVSNKEYRDFITDLEKSGQKSLYQICLPDTACWLTKLKNGAPLVAFYFRNPSYDDYPVVGISHEAATLYCNWLSSAYNKQKKRKYKKVTFTLPNKEEWIFTANKGDKSKLYTWGSGFMQNNRKQYLCNFKHTDFVYDSLTKKYTETEQKQDRETITVSVRSYYPSSFGTYNMCGNVAEMIEEKGIAMGGSFSDNAYRVRILSEKTYDKPQADIGFRVAMRVIEN